MQSGSYHDMMLEILRTDEDYIDPRATSAYFESASWPEEELVTQPHGRDDNTSLSDESPMERELTDGNDAEEEAWVDLEFPGHTWKLLHGVPEKPAPASK